MNIEEAKKNIGKEVVLDESTKPYTWASGELMQPVFSREIESGSLTRIIDIERGNVILYDGKKIIGIHPRHLKLKQPNYKIRVTEETSAEVQSLLFELGYGWRHDGKVIGYLQLSFLYADSQLRIDGDDSSKYFEVVDSQEITLPELRKLVVDSRNEYEFETEIERHEVEPSNKKVSGFFDDWRTKEMTWRDALHAEIEGKEVEALDADEWFDINDWEIKDLKNSKKFRIKPPSIILEARAYTKDELLKIVEGME